MQKDYAEVVDQEKFATKEECEFMSYEKFSELRLGIKNVIDGLDKTLKMMEWSMVEVLSEAGVDFGEEIIELKVFF